MDILNEIERKVNSGTRISPEEGLFLYQEGELGFVGMLANIIRERLNSDRVYFNRNFHIEPTNICIHNCQFCSYRRRINQDGAWEMDKTDILELIKTHLGKKATEVHIVGGVHPKRGLDYYEDLLSTIKRTYPELHIKAFTAVELDFMISKSGISLSEGLQRLKNAKT